MLELKEDDDDWVVLEKYEDNGNEILVEGTSGDKTPEKPGENWVPNQYQVVYKAPWQVLIGRTNTEPNIEQIRAAINLAENPPKLMHAAARLGLMEGFLLTLYDMSKERGYCMSCGLAGAMQHQNNSPCVLAKAIRVIQKK